MNLRSTFSSPLTDPCNASSRARSLQLNTPEESAALQPSSSPSAVNLNVSPLPTTEKDVSSSSSRLKSLRSLLPSPREEKKSFSSTCNTRTPSRSTRDKLIDEDDEEARRRREEELSFLSRVAQGIPITRGEEDEKKRQEAEEMKMKRLTPHGAGLEIHECKSMVQLLQRISDLERKNEEKQQLLLKAHLALDSKEVGTKSLLHHTHTQTYMDKHTSSDTSILGRSLLLLKSSLLTCLEKE